MTEIIGWIGTLLLAFCSLPQCIKSCKDGHSDGLSWGFLNLWFFGEIFGFFYVFLLDNLILMCNYGMNVIMIGIIYWFKFNTRRK